MRKKGDLQFDAYQADDGDLHGFARNTAGDTVAHVAVTDEPVYDEYSGGSRSLNKVSWAMANKEGRVRAGPHMLLALMARHYNLDPVADSDLSHHGAMMARSAARRGLIQGHPENPSMRTNIGEVGGGLASLDQQMEWAHSDFIHEDEERVKYEGPRVSRRVSFNTGQRDRAKEMLFRNARKAS